ncbi:transglutaminase family protein [Hansschlegelia sp. KR7-227]|jgi:transglutaminase-like putative cysteine protease|uniref:transglutaminase family protein n=1 Tax=Hansschlegelia sp. KR7-227 TaxID=3400914 RepID=UPI003BFAFD0E
MIYDIVLTIACEYGDEVKDARHILRVRPRAEEGQRVVSAQLSVDPDPDEMSRERDFFGNALDHILVLPPHGALSATMRARVAVARTPIDLAATARVRDVVEAARIARDPSPEGPMHFLGGSRITRLSPPLTAYAAESVDVSAPIGEAMLDLSRRIRAEFEYDPDATAVDTTVEEAFEGRAGVCQDFAHVMISALRGIGLPAAYVSGFLRTEPPPGKPRLEGSDAMHAWVNVWLGPAHGWRGFDPTNGMLALDDHVTAAIGRDYSDVAPIDGVLITAGPQEASHSVDVIPVEDGV